MVGYLLTDTSPGSGCPQTPEVYRCISSRERKSG